MRICRIGPAGHEKPAFVGTDGSAYDLSSLVSDITPEFIASDGLEKLASQELASLPKIEGNFRYGPPVKNISKIVAIGLNYEDHAIESNLPIPTEPIMFGKAITAITGPNDTVILPRGSTHSDWEVELGVIIGKKASYVSDEDALSYVAGYTLTNDVSERFNQKERGTQWCKGKSHDTFCPVGPWLVTPDEIEDPQNLDMFLNVNGRRKQTGNTRTMIFDLKTLISYASAYVTLMPGDLLITGTPPGVGEGMSPQQFLRAGDEMHLGIENLGEQRQTVVEWSPELVGSQS
jgi:2-keto-4-pentenoate hydratase/2-oxohepta-3-ene-1,7-dioic acid hydratase in catechol pathway